jgi:catechol 2,3-dioxygenase-like lactoylglutathione lyase family enzyme
MPREIDHVVIAVKDLEAARASWQGLGFVVTPTTRHPMGIANAFIQFESSFIELLTVVDPASVPKATADDFSLAEFNCTFLERHQGISTLVLQSRDIDADRTEFETQQLAVFGPFRFQHMATAPDGTERQVSVSMTFARERRLREAAFATCRHDSPQNFWHSEYQQHQNGAGRVSSAVLVARDPADFHEFLAKFSGQHDMISTSVGVVYHLGQSTIEVLSPVAFNVFFGETAEPDPRRFLGFRIAVADLDETRRVLGDNAVSYSERLGTLVVPSSVTGGAALAFIDEKTFSL